MKKLATFRVCPNCGHPLDVRAVRVDVAWPGEASDENLACRVCGWERDAGLEEEQLTVDG